MSDSVHPEPSPQDRPAEHSGHSDVVEPPDADEPPYVVETADFDGNGYTESALLDTDGDNIGDTIVQDFTEDGEAETIAYDTDGDGFSETSLSDLDQDGTADTVFADLDRDGVHDLSVTDSDQNGIPDGFTVL